VSEEVNTKLPARNMTVQFMTFYADPRHHSAPRYRWTDRQHYDANSQSYAV